MTENMFEQKKWNNIHVNITSTHKTERRKIHFVKAKHSSFTNKSNNTDSSQQTNNVMNGVRHNSSAHEQKKELFPEEIVRKYIKWEKMQRIGPGFMNHGNTCYMNSVLQCLLHVAPLSQVLTKESNLALRGLMEKDGRNNTTITLMYKRLVEQVLSVSAGKTISPRAMINSIRRVGKQFRPHRQEDAHEYLRQLLDCMHEESLKVYRVKVSEGAIAHTTLIGKIFGGYLRNELKCSKCSYTSRTYNHFQDLSLELSQGISSIDAAVAMFMKKEKLGKGNEWYCEKCKKKVQAAKQMTISTPPVSLVLHLKRFSYGGYSDKIKKHISFPIQLKLPITEGEEAHVLYHLTGAVVHHGYSTHNGHYIAYVKSSSDQWYEMDDSNVSMTNVKNVLRQQAYILFYTKSVAAQVTPPKSIPTQVHISHDIEQKMASPLAQTINGKELDGVKSNSTEKALTVETKPVTFSKDKSRVVIESYPVELITRLPARTCRGMFFFKGAVGKIHQFSQSSGRRSNKVSIKDINDDDVDDDIQCSFHVDSSWSEDSDVASESENSSCEDDSVESTEVDSATSAPSVLSSKDLMRMSMRGRDIGGEGLWENGTSTDQILSTAVHKHIESTEKKIRRKEQKERSKNRPSEWDQVLDAGRKKKIKTGVNRSNIFDGVNEFQKLQNSVSSTTAVSCNSNIDDYMQKLHHDPKVTRNDSKNADSGGELTLKWDNSQEECLDNFAEVERQSMLKFTERSKTAVNGDIRNHNGKLFHGMGKGGSRGGKSGGNWGIRHDDHAFDNKFKHAGGRFGAMGKGRGGRGGKGRGGRGGKGKGRGRFGGK